MALLFFTLMGSNAISLCRILIEAIELLVNKYPIIEVKMMKLNQEQITNQLSKLQGWKLTDEKWIEKKYRFKEFLTGIQFVNEVAEAAERANHHPMISIDYKMVTLRLTSWNAGGLTDLDFTSAAEFDRLFAQIKS
jgi:4a-hydroxytetrahydrobiopterin dehydratase